MEFWLSLGDVAMTAVGFFLEGRLGFCFGIFYQRHDTGFRAKG
jgi:hypothetical protein